MNSVEARKAKGIDPLKLSFVSIALGFNECEELISRYVVTKNWNQVADEVHSHNLLKKNASSSTKRIFRELRQRLETLDRSTLDSFMDALYDDKKAILLLSVFKCYTFVFDFVRVTLRDKLIVFDYRVTSGDFDSFWNSMSVEHPELDEMTATTRKKIRQVMLRILVEAGLLSDTTNPTITPRPISQLIESILTSEGKNYRVGFLST